MPKALTGIFTISSHNFASLATILFSIIYLS